jgi:putative membrane protein
MAEERTDWAQHRTLLANERNFSAWIRTGLSAMAGGLAVAELLGGEEAGLIPRLVGIILVSLGACVCLLAFWRYNQITDVLEAEGMRITPRWVAGLMVGGLLLAAALVFALIFLQ